MTRENSRIRFLVFLLLAGCQISPPERPGLKQDLRSDNLSVPSAYIPPQCYTKTIDATGQVHNPCFACHMESQRPNFINDDDLQIEYAFTETAAEENPYTNLFVDRREGVAAISDSEIDAYVSEDNYRRADGSIDLARVLNAIPELWDANGNGRWDGFVPDLEFNFDKEGFDQRKDGTMTGWRAFAYAPFPGTFWPTNGSAGDAMMRLPEAFRRDAQGQESLDVYRINLAIVEALIKRKPVAIASTDENQWGVDLNRDGSLGMTDSVVFEWEPAQGKLMSYVGQAKLLQQQGKAKLAAGLYPVGTEFLHTVRYLNVNASGEVSMANRLKELRYSRKDSWRTYAQLSMAAMGEAREKEAFPDRLRAMSGSLEEGVINGQGWTYQGFIEDAAGHLRPQTYQETTFCVGCHSGVGATADSSFAFGRKFGQEAHADGWYHWEQKSMKGSAEPKRADGLGEYQFYLTHNASGNEYRTNDEVRTRFFDETGQVRATELLKLEQDMTSLIVPSANRARQLNKAYRLIAQEQSYVRGRDATIEPVTTVHRRVESGTPTGIKTALTGPWVPLQQK